MFGATRGGKIGSAVHEIAGQPRVFKNGIFSTTDKKLVKSILSSEIYRRNEIIMVTDEDLVDRYLNGEEAEYLTNEILDSLPDEVIFELADVCRTKNRRKLNIIKSELYKHPVTNEVREVLDRNEVSTTGKDADAVVQEFFDKGILVKKGAWTSSADGSFKAQKAEEVREWCMENKELLEVID